MAEVQSRPSASRGRGSSNRAGRGGFSSRGGGRTMPRQSNGDSLEAEDATAGSFDDQSGLGAIKKQYRSELDTLKEFFPDWSDEDLVYALQERNGDLQTTIEDITEGKVSRFADVTKKTKDKSRSKAKDGLDPAADTSASSARGRGRGGFESGRGGRGARGTERGRGGISRGGRGGAAAPVLNFGGRAAEVSVPTVESHAWDAAAENASAPPGWETGTAVKEDAGWASPADAGWGESSKTTTTEPLKSSIIPQNTTKSWASMLATPKVAPVPKPAPAVPVPTQSETVGGEDFAETVPENNTAPIDESSAFETAVPLDNEENLTDRDVQADDTPAGVDTSLENELQIEPTRDELTEEALQHVPDVSVPIDTETVASTIDASSMIGSSTPYASSQQVPTLGSRPPMGGFATSAWKATGTPGRSSSFQRVMEQQQAVVMPGNHGVDRAAVQFGSMGLGAENNPMDVEEDREEVETRAQPPQEPMQAQPKASLPPAPQQTSEQPVHESMHTPKPAPGLDMPSHAQGHASTQGPPPGTSQQTSQTGNAYGQYGRYGGFGGQDYGASQKPQDAFSQQLGYSQSQQQQDTSSGYGAQSQSTVPTSQQGQSQQSQAGGFSHNQSDYNSQYSNEQSRGGYQNYYGSSFGNPSSGTQQDPSAQSQRASSGYGAEHSAYGGSNHVNQSQSRFLESQQSGSNTPVPAAATQQPNSQQPHQAQNAQQQSHGQGGHAGGYPYNNNNNSYYGGSYYGSYMNQYPNYNNYNQSNYGQQPYNNKNSMYGQPQHGYGMSPQTSYEQSTPSGGASGFGSTAPFQGRDASFGSSFPDSYARSGSAAPSQSQQGNAASGYSGYSGEQNDSYGGRSTSGMNNPASTGAGGMGQYGASSTQGASDSAAGLKPYHDNKTVSSPSLQQAGRAGSAVNNSGYGAGAAGGSQSSYQQQGQQGQQGFGGYQSHGAAAGYGNHGSQYGGLGGLGGHQGSAQGHQQQGQQQQGGQYGSQYGNGGFGNSGGYGNNYGRGGWGGNYGH